MGAPGLPWYGTDLGSAIESVEKVIAKIKTNRFDKKDLAELRDAVAELDKAIDEAKD